MTRAFVHVGLAVALVLAPALCCCKTQWLAAAEAARLPASTHDTPTALPPVESCCAKPKTSCCDTSANTTLTPSQVPENPALPHAPKCNCCTERPDAALPESKSVVSVPEQTGELLPLALAGLLAGSPKHISLVSGLHSLDRGGVDTRFAALYERHVLRC